jgi:2,3-bisphosphoglycerate-dependent phosphoglycerate mutase
MTLERVLLIRHGETDWNAQRRWQGYEPTALNKIGFTQAQALAKYLASRPIRAIYSSDLPRALQTAETLGSALKLVPEIDLRWREINVGIFQGHTTDELEKLFPDELVKWLSTDMSYRVPKGESRRALQMRAHEAWKTVIERPHGPEIAVVSHGGTIKALMRELIGEDDPRLSIHLGNTSITTFERSGTGWHLKGTAETPHL